jgi:uncharacterized protein YndB with AHSA1/START domain
MTEIRLDVDLRHPPERVWRALTEPDRVAEWFAEVDAGADRLVLHPDVEELTPPVEIELLELVPHQRIVTRWRADQLHVRVTATLAGTAEGCRLTVVQRGFVGVQGTLRRRLLRRGYEGVVRNRLPAVLDRMAAEEAAPGTSLPPTLRRERAPAASPRVVGVAAVPAPVPVGRAAWLRSVARRIVRHRGSAVILAAGLLLTIGTVSLLVARLTAAPPAGAPQVGGGSGSAPGFAVAPGVSSVPGAHSRTVPGGQASSGAGVGLGSGLESGLVTPLGLVAAYRTGSVWLGGYQGLVTITNPGPSPVSGWTVRLTLPLLGLKVNAADGAVYQQTGRVVRFTPQETTRVVGSGKPVQFTFEVEGVGQPTGCDIDGQPCASLPG